MNRTARLVNSLILIVVFTVAGCGLLLSTHAQNDLVTFPTAEVEYIIGPQLKSGSPLNPVPWFDTTASEKGLSHGNAFPATFPSRPVTGTLTFTQGSKMIQGNASQFLSEFPAPVNQWSIMVRSSDGVLRSRFPARVNSNTEIEMTAAWSYATLTTTATRATGDESDYYINLNYYDQCLVQYTNFYRTGNSQFQTHARKCTDSWWKSPSIDEGRQAVEESYAPRNSSVRSLMLRALDGRPEMWPWIVTYARYQYDIWVGQRVTYPNLYFGVRDGAYSLLMAADLARIHPDAAIRDEFRAKAIAGAENYYVRLQFPDGSWRWEDGAWIGQASQPFMIGLLIEALIQVHKLTGSATIKTSIAKGMEWLYLKGYNPNGWRGTYYQVGGTWADGTNCANGCGTVANPFPPSDPGQVKEGRQLNATYIHGFGYAYLITGDVKFKNYGDEVFGATYSGTDGYRGLADFRAKEYNESYRSGGRYLAWRLGSSTPQPSPSPTPSATPSPIPSPTSTPTPTPAPSPTPQRESLDRVWPSRESERSALWNQLVNEKWHDCFTYNNRIRCWRPRP